MPSEQILYNFSINSTHIGWHITDDVVMGGRSNGMLTITKAGNGLFSGTVSLENNGGFSSLKYQFEVLDLTDYEKIVLYVKGDGKNYQFRVKNSKYDSHAYVKTFSTTGIWQEIEISLNDFVPQFRGRQLDMPNYTGQVLEEIRFLIGNKKAENFHLEIDKIVLK